MAIARASIIRGPAVVAFNSVTFYTKDDITVTVEHRTFDVVTSAFGKVDERIAGRTASVTFTPDGKLTSGLAAVLWPYASTAYHASVLNDLDCVITPCTSAGGETVTSWTVKNCYVSSMPNLILSATKTAVGQVTITGVGLDNTAPSTSNSLVELNAAATATDAEFTQADIVTEPYTASWGATITGIEALDGFECSFEASFQEQPTDNNGVVDVMLTGLGCMARCAPLNITEANLKTIIADDKAVGASIQSANAFTITNGASSRSIALNKASPTRISPVWGALALRDGVLEVVSRRTFASGDPAVLWTITMPA